MTTDEAKSLLRTELSQIYPTDEVKAMIGIIFEQLMNYSAVDIVMRGNSELPDFVVDRLVDCIARLKHHEPIQYIFGTTTFCGNRFKVTRATLIPRPETQELVDMITKEYANRSDLRVLDIGTGTGCIAISLARALKFPQVTAFDVSSDALAVAQANASALKVKVKFELVDILNAKTPSEPAFDVIVSNPPYIAEKEKAEMDANVLDYEPHLALFVPDSDPLLFYRAIAEYALHALTPGGRLFFEINAAYSAETEVMLRGLGYEEVSTSLDFYSRPRFTQATLPINL